VKTGGEWPWLKLNGILKVTEAVFSQSGGMLIDDFSDGATFNEFEISFRMFMGRGTSRPADGLSISIGNDLTTLANPAEEGVPGAAFRVCFDAWDSGGGEAPAIEIFNGKKSIAIQKFDGKSGASDSEKFVKDDGEFLMMWDNKEWADVNIRVADGKATVNFRGYDVIDNVPIDLAPIRARCALPGPSPEPRHTATRPNPRRSASTAPNQVPPVPWSEATTTVSVDNE